MPEIHWLWT